MAADPRIGCVTVFGGSGFLGSEIVRRLAADGTAVRVAVRHPDSVAQGDRQDKAGEIQPVYADVRDETSVGLAMQGAEAAVNAVGLYVEKGAETFEAIHELGALNVAHQAATLGLDRLVHISGIGADLRSGSSYVRVRAKAELLVKDVFPRATIFRPSVMFGPEDAFLNALAEIARWMPVLPLFGNGRTRLQPVYVADVAAAAARALAHPDAPGGTYELGGPRIYEYRALIALLLRRTRRRRALLPVPFPIWDMLAALAAVLPTPPITRAQVALMKRDNVVAAGAPTLKDLGVQATALEEILPRYAF